MGGGQKIASAAELLGLVRFLLRQPLEEFPLGLLLGPERTRFGSQGRRFPAVRRSNSQAGSVAGTPGRALRYLISAL
jgi:hypothetical protein